MTLLVSRVTSEGVVMAGDSATTYGTGPRTIVRFDATKVLPIPGKRAGVSTWGVGQVEGLPIDVWLQRWFADCVRGDNTLDDIGNRLAGALNHALQLGTDRPVIRQVRMGLHIGGWIKHNGLDVPVLWHMHRGPDDQAPGELALHRDHPEAGFQKPNTEWPDYAEWLAYLRRGLAVGLRNGDYGPLATFQKRTSQLFEDLSAQHRLPVPEYPELDWWGRLTQFEISTMVQLYELLEGPQVVGGNVSYLLIPPEGPLSYFTDGTRLTSVPV